ncbi:MAG: signal peptidase I [Planctomycetes bacterium]|nr:signal peptidase I [Planctomycetota bacterium]
MTIDLSGILRVAGLYLAIWASTWCLVSFDVVSIPQTYTFMAPRVKPSRWTLDVRLVRQTDRLDDLHTRDIVWFERVFPHYPDEFQREYYASRVIAKAGQRLRIDETGSVYLEGSPLAEDYALEKSTADAMEEVLVPRDHIFVLNDHRAGNSRNFDSRTLGPLHVSQVVGTLGQ